MAGSDQVRNHSDVLHLIGGKSFVDDLQIMKKRVFSAWLLR
jgi:hypothetical protein